MKTILFATLLLTVASSSAVVAEHTKDPLAKVKDRLKKGKAVLIDVREKREWDRGHLKQARLVPLSKLREYKGRKQATKPLQKDKIIYCHCRSGVRVLQAADILKKIGYDVRPLKHGYRDLLKAGFPKAKRSSSK